MKIWVLTGPIGSGKSTVSALLAERGAAIVDADRLGHEILEDPVVIGDLVATFGSECVKDGKVDRSWLGALVFSDAEAMVRLNALTHPPLIALAGDRLKKLAAAGQHELAVLEAAVYFLWPAMPMVDKVISVVAEKDIRLKRLMESRGLDFSEARDRLKAQENMDHFWNTADIVLDNSSNRETLVLAVDQLMLENNL